MPGANNADDALADLNRTLDAVEDQFSGVPRNPSPGETPDGRMYPAQADNIMPGNGGYVVRSRGHVTTIGADGSIRVVDAASGQVVFTKPGGG